MPEVNYDWVKEQMQEAKVRVGVGKAILRLLAEWEKLDLSSSQSSDVIDLFGRLSLNHSIVPEKPNEKWVDAQPGNIKVGDEVRVKFDAFSGSTGAIHNGRRGKVVGVRYGDIIFKATDGKTPTLEGSHYSPHQLQKRVQ